MKSGITRCYHYRIDFGHLVDVGMTSQNLNYGYVGLSDLRFA
nr:hypothetical protein [Marinicella sp. W31]MDC2877172.1 hypothetical protein [Marinicella sp. W31]